MHHKNKKGSQFSRAPKAGLTLALDILKDVYELWLETATVASIQAYIQKHGISHLNHDQFELEFERLHTASTNTECDLSVDLASVKKRCFELLEHPERSQSQVKPLEDGIAKFEVASIGTGKPLSKKLEIAKVVDKKKEFEKDLRQNANFYIHFTKNLWNYFADNNSHVPNALEFITNFYTLLLDLQEGAIEPEAFPKISDLFNAAKVVEPSKSKIPSLYIRTLYTLPNDSSALNRYLALHRAQATHFKTNNLQERNLATTLALIKEVARVSSKKLENEPIFRAHYKTSSKFLPHSYGKWAYAELILDSLKPFISKINGKSEKQDLDELATLVECIQKNNIVENIFCDKEGDDKEFFTRHLEMLLSISRDNLKREDLDSYIEKIVNLTTKPNTLVIFREAQTDKSIIESQQCFVDRPELTDNFFLILLKKAQKYASTDSFKKLVTYCSKEFPESRKFFLECLANRLKQDKIDADKAKEKLAMKEAEIVKQNAKFQERQALANMCDFKREQVMAEEKAREAAERRNAAQLYAAEEPVELEPSEQSSCSSTSSTKSNFNINATWDNGNIRTTHNNVYKIGISSEIDLKEYAVIPQDLMNSFGIKVIDNQFIARANTALGTQGFKTYKPNDKTFVAEIKSLSSQNGGKRIYFTQMIVNQEGETIYLGTLEGKHDANIPCAMQK